MREKNIGMTYFSRREKFPVCHRANSQIQAFIVLFLGNFFITN